MNKAIINNKKIAQCCLIVTLFLGNLLILVTSFSFQKETFVADKESKLDIEADDLIATYVYELSGFPKDELRKILVQPISDDHELTRFLSNPEYNYTEGNMQEIANKLVGLEKWDMPLEIRIEYLKKVGAIQGLIKHNDLFILDWILKKKDKYSPTLLDALMAPAAMSQGMEKLISEDTRPKWIILSHANNPMCRLLAIKYVELWAKKEEYIKVLSYGLNDKYWWNRCLSLMKLNHLIPVGTRFIIKKFLSRNKGEISNESISMKENLLNRLAINTLKKIKEEESKLK